jgi:hypothetical protein
MGSRRKNTGVLFPYHVVIVLHLLLRRACRLAIAVLQDNNHVPHSRTNLTPAMHGPGATRWL